MVGCLSRLFLCAAALSLAFPLSGAARPARVLSGYCGCLLGAPSTIRHVERMIDALGSNGFNAIDVKFQGGKHGCAVDKFIPDVKALVDRARAKGLAFNVYLYPVPGNGRRDGKRPAHAALPVPVDARGEKVEQMFLMTDLASWKTFFAHAIRFAALRPVLGYTSLRFDIETLSCLTSYDDGNWRAFCAERPDLKLNPAAPAKERAAALKAAGAAAAYSSFFAARVKKTVVEFIAILRAHDPTIELGYMPAEHHSLAYCFRDTLATDTIPAWHDGWDLYNGFGYTPKVDKRAQAVHKAHPMNRYITWTCPNRYKPERIASSVYHAASHCDGYSIWVLWMLDDVRNAKKKPLPAGTTGADYFAAFKKANEALRADMADGTVGAAKRLAFEKVEPLVAPLSWKGVTIPALRPAGDGTGADRALVLRGVQNVVLYAKAGDPMTVTLKHLSGARRPAGLQYALLGPRGNLLRNEAVTYGATHKFTVHAAETGVHLLRVSAGTGGGPWFSVSVAAPLHWALDARKEGYLFGMQQVWVPGAAQGNPKMKVRNMPTEGYLLSIDGGAPIEKLRVGQAEFDLPPEVAEARFTRSKVVPYGENFWLSFPGGKTPYIYPIRERRLEMTP